MTSSSRRLAAVAVTAVVLTALGAGAVAVSTRHRQQGRSAVAKGARPAGVPGAIPTPGPAPGWLHTRPHDTKIYDSRGSVFQINGVGSGALGSGNRQGSSTPDGLDGKPGNAWRDTSGTDQLANIRAWGFNTYRMSVEWDNLEPVRPTLDPSSGRWAHHWNSAYLAAVQHTVARAQALGLKVILVFNQAAVSPAFRTIHLSATRPGGGYKGYQEGHGLPAWLYRAEDPTPYADHTRSVRDLVNNVSEAPAGPSVPRPLDGYEAAMRELLERPSIRDNPTVAGVDLFQAQWVDDSGATSAQVNRMYDRLAQLVSAVSPQRLILFQDFGSRAPLPRPPALADGRPVPNTVYGTTVYGGRWQGIDRLRAWSDARRWGVPLWVAQFDAFSAGIKKNADPNPSPPPAWMFQTRPDWAGRLTTTRSMLADLRRDAVGWSFYEYDGESSLLHRQTTAQFPGGVPRNDAGAQPGGPPFVSDGLIEALQSGLAGRA